MADVHYDSKYLRVLPNVDTLIDLLEVARSHPFILARRSVNDLLTFTYGWQMARCWLRRAPTDAQEYSEFLKLAQKRLKESHLVDDDKMWEEFFKILDEWRASNGPLVLQTVSWVAPRDINYPD